MRRLICLTSIATGLLCATSAPPSLAQSAFYTTTTKQVLADQATNSELATTNTSAAYKFAIASINSAALTSSQTRYWLITLSCLLASGAISWGVYRYVQQQKWQHIEFLRHAVKEFEQDPEIHKALKILDFEEYRDYTISAQSGDTPTSFRVTDELLYRALAHHDQRARLRQKIEIDQARNTLDAADLRQYQIETALRDWFNKMLNGLEHFGYFLDSGLFTVKELEPWLKYWIKLIGDPAYRRPGSSKVYDTLYSYIHHSGFFGVQKLFEKFGYRILPSPYKDDDLTLIKVSDKFDTRVSLVLAKASYLAYQDKQFVAEIAERWGNYLSKQLAKQQNQHNHTEPKHTEQKHTEPKHTEPKHTEPKNQFVRDNFRYFNNRGRDTQAYIFRTDRFMVLAFRGSQEPKDWLTNFTTQLRNFTIYQEGATVLSSYKGRVHTGFFLAWESIEQSVLAQIKRWEQELAKQNKQLPPLYITGHSLGGALATMAAAACSDYGIELAGVYTFGQPRVGDRTFTRQLNLHIKGKIFRFVNNNDIVPHVPPPFSILNPTRLYGHLGTVKYFNAGGSIVANSKLLARFIDSTWGLLKSEIGAGLDLITDHNMEYYISHLDKAIQEEVEDIAEQMTEVDEVSTTLKETEAAFTQS